MVLRLERIAWLALALLVAGCFRSAGENFVQTITPEQPQAQPTRATPATNGGVAETTPEPGMIQPATSNPSGADITATFPPITVIAPTRVNPAAIDQMQTATLQAQSTMGFITPQVPNGPITLEAPSSAATAGGGALTSTPSGLVTPTELSAQSSDGCTYTVQPGDTVYRIATHNNLTVQAVKRANPNLVGSDPVLQVGQTLNIPNCGKQPTAQPQAAGPPTAADSGIVAPAPGQTTYTVQSGDTLFKIAQHFGLTVQALVNANSLPDPDRLQLGQKIIIPNK